MMVSVCEIPTQAKSGLEWATDGFSVLAKVVKGPGGANSLQGAHSQGEIIVAKVSQLTYAN